GHRPDTSRNFAAGVASGLVDEGEGEVEEATAMTGGGVAGEGAADYLRRPAILVGQAAAVAVAAVGGRGVASEHTVAHRRRCTIVVGKAAAVGRRVTGENDVADLERPEVVDPAAVRDAGVTPGDRQARDPHGLPSLDLEDTRSVVAADGQFVG